MMQLCMAAAAMEQLAQFPCHIASAEKLLFSPIWQSGLSS